MATPEARTCDACGRRIEWRRRWAADWDRVRWCSQACRRRKLQPQDVALEAAILDLLSTRSAGATICPSEAARLVGAGAGDDEPWRDLMEPARRAARRLVARGLVEITQGGRVVDPSTARGPIRIRSAS
jgi:hypothetical protein